jgi:Mu-like prophage protein gp36
VAYCTQADLEAAIGLKKLSQLSDVNRTSSDYVDTVQVASAIEAADSLIDSYASKRYSVPFETPTRQIRQLAIKLTIHELKDRRCMVLPEDTLAQDARLKWLKMLSEGGVTPGTDPTPQAHSMVVDAAYERPSTKDVSRAKTKGYW